MTILQTTFNFLSTIMTTRVLLMALWSWLGKLLLMRLHPKKDYRACPQKRMNLEREKLYTVGNEEQIRDVPV